MRIAAGGSGISRSAFDTLAELYDLLTDWGGRLDREIPFLNRLLEAKGARTVLDAACGTGVHLHALAHLGFEVTGSDISAEMVARARDRLADVEGATVFEADFAEAVSRGGPFDAVIVIGNSLPNAGTEDRVRGAIGELGRALRPEGILVLHMLNFPKLIGEGGGLRPLRRVVEGGREYLFLKLFEIHEDRVVLDVIALAGGGGRYEQTLMRSTLHPLTLPWLREELAQAGLEIEDVFGDFGGGVYDTETSSDLIVVAGKGSSGNRCVSCTEGADAPDPPRSEEESTPLRVSDDEPSRA